MLSAPRFLPSYFHLRLPSFYLPKKPSPFYIRSTIEKYNKRLRERKLTWGLWDYLTMVLRIARAPFRILILPLCGASASINIFSNLMI